VIDFPAALAFAVRAPGRFMADWMNFFLAILPSLSKAM
jgi:hypothetical protein